MNDGNQARRFFHYDSVATVVECVSTKYKENIQKLHRNSSALLRIISYTAEVDCDELEKLTMETSLMIATEFNWVDINFHHSLGLVEANGGWSIGMPFRISFGK